MITLLLSGGLGNQLFQYCAAYAFAKRLGTSFKIDLRYYSSTASLEKIYHLDRFEIDAPVERYVSQDPHSLHRRVYRLISERRRRCFEPGLGFHSLPVTHNSTLCGLFQSVKYFEDFGDDIREQIDIKMEWDLHVDGRPLSDYAALHVRRGDYLNHAGFELPNSFAYYESALSRLKSSRVLVFSDDLGWVKKQSVFSGHDFHYFDSAIVSNDPVLEMFAMSHCGEIVIANSTYSWWAAWLSGRSERRILAPSDWILGLPAVKLQLYPETWEVVT